jgi:hypothetical protein
MSAAFPRSETYRFIFQYPHPHPHPREEGVKITIGSVRFRSGTYLGTNGSKADKKANLTERGMTMEVIRKPESK